MKCVHFKRKPGDVGKQDPPCVRTLETGKHEWNALHHRHQANDKYWIPVCPTCGWIDTEQMVGEAVKAAHARGRKEGMERCIKIALKKCGEPIGDKAAFSMACLSVAHTIRAEAGKEGGA